MSNSTTDEIPTELVLVHLQNDAELQSTWTRRAKEIRDRIPVSLSGGRGQLLKDGTISKTEAVRIQLSKEIEYTVEQAAEDYKERGAATMSLGSTLVGLFRTAINDFISRVDWTEVASGFMPEELSETH